MPRKATPHDAAHDPTAGDIFEDLRAVVRDAEQLLRATDGQAGEKIAEIRARAEESLGGAKERLRNTADAMEEKARTAARTTDDYVRDNPWRAVGIAAGVGFLLGLIGRRR